MNTIISAFTNLNIKTTGNSEKYKLPILQVDQRIIKPQPSF